MAEFETTVAAAAASGLQVGVTPLFYRSAAGRIVAAAGLCFVTGAADARTFLEAPGDIANGMDVDVTRVPADPFGLIADAAIASGAAGSMQAKFRLMTSQLAAIQASLDTLDNVVTSNRLQVDIISGGLTITRPGTATVTTPATSIASGPLIVSNVNRLGLEVRNLSPDAQLFLRRGATAATEANSPIVIDPMTGWKDDTGYTGEIRCILAAGAAAATAVVSELTA